MNVLEIELVKGLDNKFVTVDTNQTISGVKTFTGVTNNSRAMLYADRKLNSFYANPLPSIWESAKLEIAEPNLFRKFDVNYIDITASLSDEGEDWDASLIRNINTKPLLTSAEGTAILNIRIRENDLPLAKRVKLEITCDPTSGLVSGLNSRMWLTNLAILGNTVRATHKMKIDVFRDNIWYNFMNDLTRSKSAEFIDHVTHPLINFGTGAYAQDYTKIRITFYDFLFLSNVEATSDFLLRKIWWFGTYPNKINKPSSSEDVYGNITFNGDVSSLEGKLATEEYVMNLIPEIPDLNVIDVSNMFSVSTVADTSAFMFRREVGNHLIKLHGFDNSLTDDELIIVPALGFGPLYSSYLASPLTLDGINYLNYAIKIDRETSVEGKITVPNGVLTFDINYYLHDGTNVIPSYYIDTSGVMHPFSAADTPITNFNIASLNLPITINNTKVLRTNIKEILFGTDYLNVTELGAYFLHYFTSLTSVNFIGLHNVTSIGDHFLATCIALTSIDLSPFTNVTTIGECFLISCRSITSLDLTALSKVTTIGRRFLIYLNSLQSIDFSPMVSLTEFSDYTLEECYLLTSVIVKGMPSLTRIGNYFCRYSNSVSNLELELPNLISIGNYFMLDNAGLIVPDLSGISSVKIIGDYFFDGNSATTKITNLNLSYLVNLESIGRNAVSGLSLLLELNLSGLYKLNNIGYSFMSGASSLTSLIIGDVDWSNKQLDDLYNIFSYPERTIYAATEEIGNIFKLKTDPFFSDWIIVVSSNE